MTDLKQLSEDIVGGAGDDREGWYGATEALVLARAYLELVERVERAEQENETLRDSLAKVTNIAKLLSHYEPGYGYVAISAADDLLAAHGQEPA